jgi:two-component system phosphate regulon response regulator PhoB
MQEPFVLLVEDDVSLRKVIATNLVARGYMPFEADSFEHAIDMLAVHPQLMILDIRLPDASGWDVAEWADETAIPVPAIFISGYEPDRREMKRFEPCTFLKKPFDIKQLMSLVDHYLAS